MTDRSIYSNWSFTPNTGHATYITVMNGSTAVPVTMLTRYSNGSILGPGASTENPLGYAIITSVPSAGRLDVDTINNFGPTTGANPISTNGHVWGLRAPVIMNNDPSTYPRVCGFYQSRLWFAGSNKYSMIVLGSKVNVINNFDVATGQNFDGVAEFLSDTEDGPISDIGFGLNLNLWTNTTQFTVPSGLDVGITPGSFRVRNTSSYGINQAHPTKYRDSLYYISSSGKQLIKLSESAETVESADVSNTARDLITNPSHISYVHSKGDSSLFNDSDPLMYLCNRTAQMTVFVRDDSTESVLKCFFLLRH